MKLKKLIRAVSLMLVLPLILSVTISAALPPSLDVQWDNADQVVCVIQIVDNVGEALASVMGKFGSTLEIWTQ